MDSLLLQDGLKLMLVGMGTVFVFLTLLVGATSAMSALAKRLQPAPVASLAPVAVASAAHQEAEVVVAIGAAIAAHRSRSDTPQASATPRPK